MNTFNIGDYVLVRSGKSDASVRLAGQIGTIVELHESWARLDIELTLPITTKFPGKGIWLTELRSAVEFEYEYIG